MSRRTGYIAITLVGLALVTPAVAWAHARLTKSEPANQAKLTAAPTAIRLWFSEAPEIALTHVTLTDSMHATIATGAVARGATKLAVTAPISRALTAGRYTIAWRTAAADGHPTSGQVTFSVVTATPAPIKKP